MLLSYYALALYMVSMPANKRSIFCKMLFPHCKNDTTVTTTGQQKIQAIQQLVYDMALIGNE